MLPNLPPYPSSRMFPLTPFSLSASEVFFGRDGGRIGGQYMKVIYTEYTDDTFTTKKPPENDLGILGKASRFCF